ncbi:MAG: BMP family ABC transporter substrate-binding protein [Desulfopila sp.]|nr:BMP family ABC transporter substrate-binding protein [Desulfopila sp.]
MKKTALILLIIFVTEISICSAGTTVGFLVPVSGLGDHSFNDMTYAGLIRAKNMYHFELIRQQCIDSRSENHGKAMEKLIEQQADIIITNGWEFTDVVKEYAVKYPDRFFILNDFPLAGFPNVISNVFAQHEGSFLAGALAAWTTTTGKIGFIGGRDMPVIRSFLTGFRDGVAYTGNDIEMHTIFLSGENDQSSGFDNPEQGRLQAEALYNEGVDIIFSVAGLSGNGIIRAAADTKNFVIGVDADQDYMAKGYVLTSVIKRLDLAVLKSLHTLFEGDSSPGIYTFGLREGGVSLSPMTYTRHLLPEETIKKVAHLRDLIIAGEINVTNILDSDITP